MESPGKSKNQLEHEYVEQELTTYEAFKNFIRVVLLIVGVIFVFGIAVVLMVILS